MIFYRRKKSVNERITRSSWQEKLPNALLPKEKKKTICPMGKQKKCFATKIFFVYLYDL
jgi:hypothetical protein